LAKDPKLILADEPTANIDEKSAKELLDILKN
jgi:ABC-type antimicrobial peptide transport system, ATPase component